MNLPERTCAVCGKVFTPNNGIHRFCSKDCREIMYPRSKAVGIVKKCAFCGTEFRSKSKSHKFCSKTCSIEIRKNTYAKKTPVSNKCINCGKETSGKFCGSSCRIEYELKSLRSKAGNTQTIDEIIERSKKLDRREINYWLIGGFTERLKEEIKRRDGYRCYICGKETGLHVHHIVPRAQGGPHIPENLITLCSGCHRSVESGNVEKAIKKCVERAVKNAI